MKTVIPRNADALFPSVTQFSTNEKKNVYLIPTNVHVVGSLNVFFLSGYWFYNKIFGLNLETRLFKHQMSDGFQEKYPPK